MRSYWWLNTKKDITPVHKHCLATHTEHTTVLSPNPEPWLMIYDSGVMMIIRWNINILTIITREMGKLKTHGPIYCMKDNWEKLLNLRPKLDRIYHNISSDLFLCPLCYYSLIFFDYRISAASALIARFMGLSWGPSGADRTQVGPMLAPWTLLSGWFTDCMPMSSTIITSFHHQIQRRVHSIQMCVWSVIYTSDKSQPYLAVSTGPEKAWHTRWAVH